MTKSGESIENFDQSEDSIMTHSPAFDYLVSVGDVLHDLVDCMTHVRLSIGIGWTIMQNIVSFQPCNIYLGNN